MNMNYPLTRNRRLRASPGVRKLVAETSLKKSDFIVPIFITEGEGIREEIPSMPGYFRQSRDLLLNEISRIQNMGFGSVLLFVKVEDHKKDNNGTEAINPDGLMQSSIREIKKNFPDLIIISDVALDPYSSFGHDGIVKGSEILNDPTTEILARMALSHAEAGADVVAPSDMMDGRVKVIREALEAADFTKTAILSYSAKYASSFYGPFRDALDSSPGFGDKKTYQMDPANSREAIKAVLMEQEEGADIIMIKPALPYLDIISKVREKIYLPIAAYQVSGEYAMIKAASSFGWIDEKQAILESLVGIKRAGADLIVSYFWEYLNELL